MISMSASGISTVSSVHFFSQGVSCSLATFSILCEVIFSFLSGLLSLKLSSIIVPLYMLFYVINFALVHPARFERVTFSSGN